MSPFHPLLTYEVACHRSRVNELSSLELAAAEAICAQLPQGGSEMLEQVRNARVVSREFTAYGFYTVIQTLSGPPVQLSESPFGHVQTRVGPTGYELQFMLHFQDGRATMIEAYSFGEGYGDLDLLTCEFKPVLPFSFADAGLAR